MTLKLISSEPGPEMEQRLTRIRTDVIILRNEVTGPQAVAISDVLERVRDDITRILERAKRHQP